MYCGVRQVMLSDPDEAKYSEHRGHVQCTNNTPSDSMMSVQIQMVQGIGLNSANVFVTVLTAGIIEKFFMIDDVRLRVIDVGGQVHSHRLTLSVTAHDAVALRLCGSAF